MGFVIMINFTDYDSSGKGQLRKRKSQFPCAPQSKRRKLRLGHVLLDDLIQRATIQFLNEERAKLQAQEELDRFVDSLFVHGS